jgi:hypothetical protein
MAEITEDRTDPKRALAQLANSGDRYIVEFCSTWQDGELVGTRVLRSCGPIHNSELHPDSDAVLVARSDLRMAIALFDRIDSDDWEMTDEDANWLQAEADAGRLRYPIGVRWFTSYLDD